MKHFITNKQKLGLLGENIVARFYQNKGFIVLERNWASKDGEIDLIVTREPPDRGKEPIVFIEIKTVSCENLDNLFLSETKINPVEQFHVKKQDKLLKTISDYLLEKNISHETLWSVDLVCVYVDLPRGKYKLNIFRNCPLEQ